MGNSGKLSARKIESAQRQQKAIDLRLAGATFEKIGDALGVSRQAAHKMVGRAVSQMAEDNADAIERVRAIEVARLDRLLLGVWQPARSGDLRAVDRALKIMERRARLLGLDRPQGLEISTSGEVVFEVTIPAPRIGPHGAQVGETIEGETDADA